MSIINSSIYNGFHEFVLFFPQMRPEVRAAQAIVLNEEEKAVLEIIKTQSPISLNDLKTKSELSGKKWDKTIKGLTKNNLAKVNQTENGLMVERIG